MLTQTAAIKQYLQVNTHKDLANLYTEEMETQVLAAQDNGQRVAGEYQGRAWNGWADPNDPTLIWKSFRIPYKAKTTPEYTPKPQRWPLGLHADGIGMTGWNWVQRKSLWVAYDFDSIANHQQGLTADELEQVKTTAMSIPWVTVRKSTSGKGFHVYVFLGGVRTENHTEHAALGRAILGMLSAKTGFDFKSKVDSLGGNMWVWARKMKGTDGLTLVKKGSILIDIPPNWKDHTEVVKGNRRKNLPKYIENTDIDEFEELCGTRPRIKLDEVHLKLQEFLEESGAQFWFDQDHWMMVCHTADLKKAHRELNFRGIFETIATGKEHGADHNAFCFSGDTELITRQGPKKFRDVTGTFQDLYVHTPEGMKWIKCPIKSFGIQETVPIEFGNHTSVRATLNHRWFHCSDKDYGINYNRVKQTWELKTNFKKCHGDSVPLAKFKLNEPDPKGYAHGFIFGDGHYIDHKEKTYTRVRLFKRDIDLLHLLSRFGNPGSAYVEGHGYLPTINNMPDSWKELPKNPTREYALGFILGLLCADNGQIRKGSFAIVQVNYRHMVEIRKLAIYAGLITRDLRPIKNSDGDIKFSEEYSWALTMCVDGLKPEWILRSDLRKKLDFNFKHQITSVKSIDFEDKIKEEVFCAIVPSYLNFTLANGVITHNCFPMRKGGWSVRRYSQGICEHASWEQDSKGYTRCFYNQEPDLKTAARSNDGVEDERGGFEFTEAKVALKTAQSLGADVSLPHWAMNRTTILKHHKKDGRLIMEVKREASDNGGEMLNWREDKGRWKRIFNTRVTPVTEPEVGNNDDLVRHLITNVGDDAGWVVNAGDGWQNEPLKHVNLSLKSLNFADREINAILGNCVLRGWTLVNIPFEDEFPGDRRWNRGAAQLKYKPKLEGPFHHPTWSNVLNHCGSGLDDTVKDNAWCQANGVLTGGEYLKLWVASLFQKPTEHLPYLFLFSEEENTGKSTFHQAISMLMTRGYVDGKTALMSQGSFTGELECAILCYAEELDLSQNREARSRIKEWVTSKYISVHKKNQTPYQILNTTHWVQTANDMSYCPVFPGDTRITVCYVKPLKIEIPETELYQRLEKEASDFLGSIMSVELPRPDTRLSIPTLETEEKRSTARNNMTPLQTFVDEYCHLIPGALIPYGEFYDRFTNWLSAEETGNWSKTRVGRELSRSIPKGRNTSKGGKFYVSNISFDPETPPDTPWRLGGDRLVR